MCIRDSWYRYPKCRQTKIFFPEPNKGKSEQIMKLDRVMLSTMVQWLTGFTFLNRHEFIVGKLDFNECRYCFLEEETSSHLITDCEVLWQERVDSFRQFFLDKSRPTWSVPCLVKYLTSPTIKLLTTPILPE